ncbi:hypothetical protein Tco_1414529 [Tanacetum coccineum]
MAEGLSGRMLMEHSHAQGQSAMLDLDTSRALQFQLGGVRRRMRWREFILGISSVGDFLGTTPFYTSIRDLMLRLCHKLIACNILGRSQAPEKVTELKVIIQDLPMIDMAELVVAAGAPNVAKGALDIDKGGQAISAPIQAPQPPVAGPARTMAQRLARLEEDVHRIQGALGEQIEVLDSMAYDFSRFTTWTVTRLSRMMDPAGVRYMSYSDYHIPYVRRTRRRTDDASTLTPQQSDP